MKKITVLLLAVFLGALLCTACVTKKGNNNNLDRGRSAAIDASGRMNNALD
ncbi:MAG: hypothetical protein LBF74_05315 [Treponema sp.]|jgi:preprotein translocase subunit SecG|nr:hypothetical protein [Treponema sp.]